MKYIVYCVTNTVNNKIYIGVHETETPEKFDGYLGCGIFKLKCKDPKDLKGVSKLRNAIKTYGYNAFKRETIKVFDTKEEALKLEAEIVNEEFLKRPDVYNMVLGGGIPPRHDKPIYLYSLEGEFIKEYPSLTEAGKVFNAKGCTIGISANHKRTSFGYLWSFTKEDHLDVSAYYVYKKQGSISIIPRKVGQYTLDGILIRVYPNTKVAKKDFSNVGKVLRGQAKHCHGYIFKYLS